MSGQMKSMPATSSPTMRAASSAISTLSGWASKVLTKIKVDANALEILAGQLDHLALVRHRLGRVALAREDLERVGVDLDLRQHLLVPDATTRVGVGDLDELGDGVGAVADDVRGDALGDRLHPSADDEAAVLATGDEGLD